MSKPLSAIHRFVAEDIAAGLPLNPMSRGAAKVMASRGLVTISEDRFGFKSYKLTEAGRKALAAGSK